MPIYDIFVLLDCLRSNSEDAIRKVNFPHITVYYYRCTHASDKTSTQSTLLRLSFCNRSSVTFVIPELDLSFRRRPMALPIVSVSPSPSYRTSYISTYIHHWPLIATVSSLAYEKHRQNLPVYCVRMFVKLRPRPREWTFFIPHRHQHCSLLRRIDCHDIHYYGAFPQNMTSISVYATRKACRYDLVDFQSYYQ